MAIFISQVRADIQLDPYSKAPVRQTSATGGNALLHFANWILEFEARYKKDYILEDDKKAPDRVGMLKQMYEDEFERALSQDEDSASFRIAPYLRHGY